MSVCKLRLSTLEKIVALARRGYGTSDQTEGEAVICSQRQSVNVKPYVKAICTAIRQAALRTRSLREHARANTWRPSLAQNGAGWLPQ